MKHCERAPILLETIEWTALAETHLAAASEYSAGPKQRRDCGIPHPVEDFLFEYYPYPFALIELWQPGLGFALRIGDEDNLPERFKRKRYRIENGISFLDATRMPEKELQRLEWILDLLRATQSHTPHFSCYGLHEWAMVYRAEKVRHMSVAPLRLTQVEIDSLVESRPIVCTHHDAFRFFAADARKRNRIQPTLDTRHKNEQPGCVHANMDLYKWAAKSMPWIGSGILLEAFALARELRDLDMRASPYDLLGWDIAPIEIEKPEGRREYESEQRRLASAASALRGKLIARLDEIIQTASQALSSRPRKRISPQVERG